MTKLWYYILNEFRLTWSQIGPMSLSYLIIPLAFSFFFAWSFTSAYQPDYQPDPISISLDNQDEGEYAQALESFITAEEQSTLLEMTPESDSDFHLIIESGYSENLDQTLVDIQGKPNASQTSGNILTGLVQQFQQALVEQTRLMEMAPNDFQAINQTMQEELQPFMNEMFEKETYQTENTISSAQYSSIAIMHYILFMAIIGGVSMTAKEEFSGLNKRLSIVPLSAFEKLTFSTIANVLVLVFFAAIYLVIWKLISPTTFLHNPLFYLGWFALLGFVLTSIIELIQQLFKPKVTLMITQLMVYAYLVLIAMPLDDLIRGPIGDWIANNPLREIFQAPLIAYLNTGQGLVHLPLALVLLAVGIVSLAAAIIVKHRKEVA